jgi:hypothetical protein
MIHEPLCRVPQDINLDPSTKSASVGGKNPNMDKPRVLKLTEPPLNPQSPKDSRGSPGVDGAPPCPTRAALSQNPVGTSSGLESIESLKASPPSPRSYGLRAADGYQHGEGSLVP